MKIVFTELVIVCFIYRMSNCKKVLKIFEYHETLRSLKKS